MLLGNKSPKVSKSDPPCLQHAPLAHDLKACFKSEHKISSDVFRLLRLSGRRSSRAWKHETFCDAYVCVTVYIFECLRVF